MTDVTKALASDFNSLYRLAIRRHQEAIDDARVEAVGNSYETAIYLEGNVFGLYRSLRLMLEGDDLFILEDKIKNLQKFAYRLKQAKEAN